MATLEAVPRSHDRHPRRKPFTAFMKRLANLKNSSDSSPAGSSSKGRKTGNKNNPYPESGWAGIAQPSPTTTRASMISPMPSASIEDPADSHSRESPPGSRDGHQNQRVKSMAPTVSTKADTTHSDGQSKAGTLNTTAGALSSNCVGGGAGSTFSSPAPSVRSLTTTMTTMQSAAPAHALNVTTAQPSASQAATQPVQFSHQFPTSPVSAIPSHVVGGHSVGGHPSYNLATANNLLTDNASIVTLASSSKRRRRNSLDTNASVKALAPSSIFGGSRESLPLSVLSGPVPDTSSLSAVQTRPALGGTPAAERASVYSSSGVIAALASDRSSYYAAKQANMGDGASVRSGFAHHGRNDSLTGSIGGVSSPLVGRGESVAPVRAGPSSQLPIEGDDDHEKASK